MYDNQQAWNRVHMKAISRSLKNLMRTLKCIDWFIRLNKLVFLLQYYRMLTIINQLKRYWDIGDQICTTDLYTRVNFSNWIIIVEYTIGPTLVKYIVFQQKFPNFAMKTATLLKLHPSKLVAIYSVWMNDLHGS